MARKNKENVITEYYDWRDGILKYEIDKENKTVYCVFFNNSNFSYINEKISKSLNIDERLVYAMFGLLSPDPIVGKAVCSELDKFNVKTGKRIAFIKMRMKYHSFVMGVYRNIEKFFMNGFNSMKSLIRDEFDYKERISFELKESYYENEK